MAESLASFSDDSLPSEGEYESRDILFEAINAWAKTRGYAFTTGRLTREKSGKLTIIYSCDCYCKPPSVLTERR